ncbi:hypothetical protein L218DRAFT_725461 [Marasmius fiardii PR-910]|nr:hypothetical protein L218DRAFT_725461 [Marasmius fiardii PR-910]
MTIRSRCGTHFALAFLLPDAQLDAHEFCSPPKGNANMNSLRGFILIALREGARDVWQGAKMGRVRTKDNSLHSAVILAHNETAKTRRAPSKEQVEEMKKRMKITWDPHWYRCDIVSKA